MKRRLLGLLSAAVVAFASVPSATVYAADQQDTGVLDGYNYELWNQDYTGIAQMTPGPKGTFSCSWQGCHNCLFRSGKKFDNYPQWDTLDGIQVTYNCDYHPQGNSYLCIYGWTKNPLVEYYIVESYGTWRPPGGQGLMGTINVDGGTYEVYSVEHDGPSIEQGVTHFKQYWSVRMGDQQRTSGTITISEHFKAWEQFGMKMGGLYEVATNVEGYGGNNDANGRAEVTQNDLKIGNIDPSPDPDPTPDPEPEDGYYFNCDFEDGTQNWKARGDSAKIALDTASYYEGKQSLAVSGRTDNWHGAELSLSSSFKGGNSYSFNTAVLQQSGSATEMQMTLQYTDSSGQESYDKIASVSAKSGEWTALGNSSYTIPSGAKSMKIYIEAPESLTAFNIDAASGAVDGKASGITTGGGTVSGGGSTTGGSTGTTSSGTNPGPRQGDGFKDYFANFFKIGTSVSPHELGSGSDFLKKNYSSITPENELKPDSILDQTASKMKGDNVSTQVNLSRAAQTLSFCEQNGISLRGHTFVWYSQTPEWFFKDNFDDNGSYVSKEIMNQRLENFIKNTFAAIAAEYPKLDLYAYDVCNELFINDGGGLRPSNGQGSSGWARVYGDNNDEYIINAFTYARKYAPANCKLYINDYNEYIPAKCDDIYNIAMKLKEKGVIDGIGMQSHLASTYPSAAVYQAGLEKFLSTGLEVQITELDITKEGNQAAQFQLYLDVFKLALEHADQIPAVTIWGTMDSVSWRREGEPLLFTDGYTPKSVYYDILALADEISPPGPQTESTTTTTSTTTTSTTTTTATTADSSTSSSSSQTTSGTTTSTTASSSDLKPSKLGDVNSDGDVNVKDAVLLARLVGGDSTVQVDNQGMANANVDGAAGITTTDLTMLLKALVNLVTL